MYEKQKKKKSKEIYLKKQYKISKNSENKKIRKLMNKLKMKKNKKNLCKKYNYSFLIIFKNS